MQRKIEIRKHVKRAIELADSIPWIDKSKFESDDERRAWTMQMLFLAGTTEVEFAWDCDSDDFGYIFDESLPNATMEEEALVIHFLLERAARNMQNGKWPFEQGSEIEWLWGEFVHHEVELFLCENKGSEKTLFEILTCKKLPAYEEVDMQQIIDIFEVEDAFGICQMFYPSAWTNEIVDFAKNNEVRFIYPNHRKTWDVPFGKLFKILDEYVFNQDNKTEQPKPIVNNQGEKKRNRHLYLMKCQRNSLYKIGISTNPKHRESTLASEDPSITIVGSWPDMSHHESGWHKHFANERVRGEWFNLTSTQVKFFCNRNSSGQGAPTQANVCTIP